MNIVSIPSRAGGTLYLGEMPGRDALSGSKVANTNLFEVKEKADIDQIDKLNLDTIVVLLSRTELRPFPKDLLSIYRQDLPKVNVVHFPIDDFKVPESYREFNTLVTGILQKINSGKNVLIHCAAGMGRTGLTAAGVLIRSGLNPSNAILAIRSRRPGSIENHQQEEFLRQYFQVVHPTN